MSEREQFESWFEEHTGWDAEDYPNKYLLDVCYEAWQASREALKAEQGEDSELLAAAKKLERDVDGILYRIKQGAVDGWIACADRMPEVGRYVICLDDGINLNGMVPDHDNIYTAAYCDRNDFFTTNYWGDHDWMSKSHPTHWMPIPNVIEKTHPIDTTPNQYDALGKGGEK